MGSVEVRWLGRVDYAAALELQENVLAALHRGEGPEALLLLEHEAVYTIGRTRDRSSLLAPEKLQHPVIETNRGGKATFHGPGQLVGYPILDLSRRGKDLHHYMRFLEEVLFFVCEKFGVKADRREGLTGSGVGKRKIAFIGVGLRHWITMHGFGLNVSSDLSGFSHITPCGLTGVEMTSLSLESEAEVAMEDVVTTVEEIFVPLLEEKLSFG